MQLELSASEYPIALIQKFDRRETGRIQYMSAKTAFHWDSEEGGYYTNIAIVV